MRKGNEGKDSNESEGTERVRRDDMFSPPVNSLLPHHSPSRQVAREWIRHGGGIERKERVGERGMHEVMSSLFSPLTLAYPLSFSFPFSSVVGEMNGTEESQREVGKV